MYHLPGCLIIYTPSFWYANVEFTICLPYINSSVFRYLRHILQEATFWKSIFFSAPVGYEEKPSRRIPIVLGTFTDCRYVVLRAIMNTGYESSSTIGCQECTTILINMIEVVD